MKDVLPDCRLKRNETFGSVVMDWPLPEGGSVRVECVKVYCGNCGADGGYVPKDNTGAVFYLCDPCYEKHGPPAGTVCLPDQAYRDAVAYELQQRFGEGVTPDVIAVATERGELGRALELLTRESPYGS